MTDHREKACLARRAQPAPARATLQNVSAKCPDNSEACREWRNAELQCWPAHTAAYSEEPAGSGDTNSGALLPELRRHPLVFGISHQSHRAPAAEPASFAASGHPLGARARLEGPRGKASPLGKVPPPLCLTATPAPMLRRTESCVRNATRSLSASWRWCPGAFSHCTAWARPQRRSRTPSTRQRH